MTNIGCDYDQYDNDIENSNILTASVSIFSDVLNKI